MRTLSDLLRDVFHLAYVTEDIEAATGWFESTLGTSRCHTRYASSMGGSIVVDGQPAAEWVIDVAMVNAGPTNFEIIRPVSGAVELYREAIRPGAPATFHHVGARVADFDEATAVVEASGRAWKQHGVFGDTIRFGYVELTAELGHHVEVMELSPAAVDWFALLEAESNR